MRRADHWTSLLAPDCPLAGTDALFEERFAGVAPMDPVTQEDAARLKRYRDDVSAALGLRSFAEQANRYIAQHEILMQAEQPLLTFFDDMFCFVPHRIPRDGSGIG